MNDSIRKGFLKHLDFICSDILALSLSYWGAYLIRQSIGRGLRREISYRTFFVIVILFYILAAYLTHSYREILRRNGWAELLSVSRTILLTFVVLIVYLVLSKQTEPFSRLFLLFIFGLDIAVASLFRILLKGWLRRRIDSSSHYARLLVMGPGEELFKAAVRLSSLRYTSYRVSGAVLWGDADREALSGKLEKSCGTGLVADEETVLDYVRLHVVDEIYVCTPETDGRLLELIREFISMGIVVHIGSEGFLFSLPNLQIDTLGDSRVFTSCFRVASGWELMLKRLMDILGGLVGVLITGLLFLIVAPMIRKKSPGPVFFVQERVGRNGRRFKLYKFRSMVMNADEMKESLIKEQGIDSMMFKMEDDPRIIPGIGQFIRRTSIDEFPQFYNVLRGDMSLVGTRPPTVQEFERYESRHKIRLSFRPGLTGLWQISGRSRITDFEEVVRLDEQYIASWSILKDIEILIRTVKVVLTQDGAA